MKILILETDWQFAGQAMTYLESHAHLVVHQVDAGEAIQRAAHWSPDLVIVAADLADTGVIEAMNQLDTPPAVLLTGWMDRYNEAWRAWQRGGHELLLKPILRADELEEAIVSARENAVAGTTFRRNVTANVSVSA
jgi:DNA-binding response OmpR family regulator